MEEKKEQIKEEEKQGFFDKVKKAIAKFFKGIKNFFVKTGRVNSSNCYGCIEGIGDLLVYDDHALISAVGMDDVVFTGENVISYSFDGLGRTRRNRATVKYSINLDDNVVFPEKVREKNNVKNLIATIFVDKERSHLFGSGSIEYFSKGSLATSPYKKCDVYGYGNCFVIVVKLERRNGEKIEKYEESILYPFKDILSIKEAKANSLLILFNDDKTLEFTPLSETIFNKVKSIAITK